MFSWLADLAQEAFALKPVLVYGLPVFGIATIYIYKLGGVALRFGTLDVIVRQRASKLVPVKLAPCIALGTSLTLLGGGSVGKEAAALQLGAAISSGIGGKFKSFKGHEDIVVAAGMAAAFSALLFAPLAASCFAVELSRKRRQRLATWRSLVIPFSAVVAWGVASFFEVGRLWNPWLGMIALPDSLPVPGVAAIGIAAALVTVAFIFFLKLLRSACVRFVPNPFVSSVIAGVVALGFVLTLGTTYSGTGSALIAQALSGEAMPYESFALKLLLTSICLSLSLKGGEVMPVLCAGACMGSVVAQLLGVGDQSFFAAVGMIALFAGCTGCPFASLLLSVEAFGFGALPWFALAIVIAHFCTLHIGLYETDTWNLEGALSRLRGHARQDLQRAKSR